MKREAFVLLVSAIGGAMIISKQAQNINKSRNDSAYDRKIFRKFQNPFCYGLAFGMHLSFFLIALYSIFFG